jgi:chlorophyll(ide) b reductase
MTANMVEDIIDTNIKGSILSTKHAVDLIMQSKQIGHVFNIAGAGSNGMPTSNYAVYGATKAGISQFTKTLQKELHKNDIGIHIISPGMMITDLLVEGTTDHEKYIFNILCEYSDTVADIIVPQIYEIVDYNKKRERIEYLTLPRLFHKLVNMHALQNRFFVISPPSHYKVPKPK